MLWSVISGQSKIVIPNIENDEYQTSNIKFIVTILNKSNVLRTNSIYSKIKTIYKHGKTKNVKDQIQQNIYWKTNIIYCDH